MNQTVRANLFKKSGACRTISPSRNAAGTIPAAFLLLLVWTLAAQAQASKNPCNYCSINSGNNPGNNPYQVVSAHPAKALSIKLFHPPFKANSNHIFAGGDAAYSIEINKGRSLWLFGDSFFGPFKGKDRKGCHMNRNTIALNGRFVDRKPVFFDVPKVAKSEAGTRYYWPGDGTCLQGRLYLFMHETIDAPDEPPPFKFKALSDHLLVVQNPFDKPQNWHWRDIKLTNKPPGQMGIACLESECYLYIYMSAPEAANGQDKNPTALARVKLSELKAARETLACQWFTKEGWVESCPDKSNRLAILWQDGVSEMSVTRVKGLPGYFAFYLPFAGKAIMMRHADKPEGPWSKSSAVYQLPKASPDEMFYSVKAHKQYATGRGEVILTYCSNTTNQARLLSDPKIYFPTAIKITLKNYLGKL